MSDERLTPELQSLLAAEKDAGGPDAGARDRVAGRLAQTLGVTLAAAGASAAATSGAQAVLPKALIGKSLAAKLLIAAVVGGVGAGGVITTVTLWHRHVARSAAPVIAAPPSPSTPVAPSLAPPVAQSPSGAPSVAPSVAAAPSVVQTPSAAAPSAAATSVAAPSATAPSSASAAGTTAPSLAAPAPSPPVGTTAPSRGESHRAPHHDLAAERALLAEARTAMQSSDATRALGLLDAHARRFAHGQLAEERDAMRVGALWLAGDRDTARRRADDFARRHPDSLFLPSVQRAVSASPQ